MSTFDLRSDARAAMPALPGPGHLAESALATWRGRMINEYSSSVVFDGLADQMREAGHVEWADECVAFANEERRHGVLCGAVVEALGGEASAPFRLQSDFPKHEDCADRTEALLRNLLSISCLSETVAVALIGAERLEMPDGELRELLTKIYSDEVGHARFGWRIVHEIVPALSTETRLRLSQYLALAFADLERHELAHLNPGARPPKEGAALGLCNGQDARQLFYDTVAEVIVPQLESVGLEAKKAWGLRRAVG